MKQTLHILVFTAILLTACNKEDIDQEKPVINLAIQDSYPRNCDTLWLDESFTFKAMFTDNRELGSFSIEIHENFDHHSHSTEAIACELMPEKEPVNPFEFLKDYPIPEGLSRYDALVEITIPQGNIKGDYDDGDYDLYISLTDREGWSAQKGLSVKLMRK